MQTSVCTPPPHTHTQHTALHCNHLNMILTPAPQLPLMGYHNFRPPPPGPLWLLLLTVAACCRPDAAGTVHNRLAFHHRPHPATSASPCAHGA